jgi:hypothetical protein
MTTPAAGRTDNRGRYPKKAVILLLVTASTLAMGYNTPLIQWVLGTLSLQIKRQEREDAHLLVDDYIASVIHKRIGNMSEMMTGVNQSTRRNTCLSATRPPPP